MTKANQNIEAVNAIKAKLNANKISYDEAVYELIPVIARMNKVAERIAKKHKRTFIPFSASGLLR